MGCRQRRTLSLLVSDLMLCNVCLTVSGRTVRGWGVWGPWWCCLPSSGTVSSRCSEWTYWQQSSIDITMSRAHDSICIARSCHGGCLLSHFPLKLTVLKSSLNFNENCPLFQHLCNGFELRTVHDGIYWCEFSNCCSKQIIAAKQVNNGYNAPMKAFSCNWCVFGCVWVCVYCICVYCICVSTRML
jgi:hypothetical protein